MNVAADKQVGLIPYERNELRVEIKHAGKVHKTAEAEFFNVPLHLAFGPAGPADRELIVESQLSKFVRDADQMVTAFFDDEPARKNQPNLRGFSAFQDRFIGGDRIVANARVQIHDHIRIQPPIRILIALIWAFSHWYSQICLRSLMIPQVLASTA